MDDSPPLTLGDFKRLVTLFGAWAPPSEFFVDPERVERAGPRPRGRWHMLTHRKKRIRKKWAKRLAPVRRAELEWSLRSGLILDHGRLYVLRDQPLDLMAWPSTRIEFDPTPIHRLGMFTSFGEPLLTNPRRFITMEGL